MSRFARLVDNNTRTMITEIEVPNPNLELMPGMYAKVRLKVAQRPQALTVPVEAVAGEKRPTVLVLNRDRRIEERSVRLGLETPEKFEVLSGLQEGELVIVGNRARFQAGEIVEPKLLAATLRAEK